jgi:hypothetical protein
MGSTKVWTTGEATVSVLATRSKNFFWHSALKLALPSSSSGIEIH